MPIKEWENQIALLNENERADPFEVIETFANQNTIFEMREEYYHLFTAAMYSKHFEEEDAQAKGNRMWLLEVTLKLTEAVHLINQLKDQGRLQYSIKPMFISHQPEL